MGLDDIWGAAKTAYSYTPIGAYHTRVLPWAAGQMDPAKGFNSMAEAMDQASQMSSDFSNTQWGRQMEGLDKALGAMSPSDSLWYQTYGTQRPGAMEEYWKQYGARFNDPTASGDALSRFDNYMKQPSYMEGSMLQQANRFLDGRLQSEQAYERSQQQLSGPSASQNQYNLYAGAYGGPGAAESFYQQNAGRFNQPTNTADMYRRLGAQLEGPGRSEMFQLDAPSTLQNSLAAAQRFASAATNIDRGEQEAKGYYRGANDINDYYASQRGALSGPGTYENWITSELYGVNPAMEMEKQEGLASLNQELARRGHFNSGGAGVALGKFLGTHAAKSYENRAQRAAQAQQMQLGRIGTGAQVAGQSSGNRLAQGQALAGFDVNSEAARLGRMQFGQSAAEAASREAMEAQRLKLAAAGQADQSQLARLQGLSSMANTADQGTLAQLRAQQEAARSAQEQELARLAGGMSAAGQSDQSQLARLQALFQQGQGVDDANFRRGQQYFNMGQAMDQGQLARYGMLGQLSQQQDSATLARLLGGGQLAGMAQGAELDRLRQMFGTRMGIDQTRAGLYGGFYGQGGALSGQPMSDAINAMVNASEARAGGTMARQDMAGQLLGMLLGMA